MEILDSLKRMFSRDTSRKGHSHPGFKERPRATSRMGAFADPSPPVGNGADSHPFRTENKDDAAARENERREANAPETEGRGKGVGEVPGDNGQRNSPDLCPTPQPAPSPHLENGHKPILEQIQSLLGIAKRLEDNPQNEELRGRLVSGVLGFTDILEAEGLEVMAVDVNPAAFIPVVDDVDRPLPLVVRPVILRDGNLILKGIRCLPKAAPGDDAPGEAKESVPGGTR